MVSSTETEIRSAIVRPIYLEIKKGNITYCIILIGSDACGLISPQIETTNRMLNIPQVIPSKTTYVYQLATFSELKPKTA